MVKVGDKIEILRGTDNFNQHMEKLIGKICTVTCIYSKDSIKIKEDNETWHWQYAHNHYRLVSSHNKIHELW